MYVDGTMPIGLIVNMVYTEWDTELLDTSRLARLRGTGYSIMSLTHMLNYIMFTMNKGCLSLYI